MLKVLNNLTKTRVEQLENKNQFVIVHTKENGSRVYSFQSYDTLIAVYDRKLGKLYINWNYWDYSKTTMKHLKIFINGYTCFTYEDKKQFTKFIETNINVIKFTD